MASEETLVVLSWVCPRYSYGVRAAALPPSYDTRLFSRVWEDQQFPIGR